MRIFLVIIVMMALGCKSNSQKTEQTTQATDQDIKINFPVQKSDDVWKEELTEMQYYVLRQAGTERAFSGALLEESRTGVFTCAGCGQSLFKSDTKFKSGTGWPSFYDKITGAIYEDVDYKIGYARTEVLCSNCGGHLGHVFDDGPQPTGLRYCINSAALDFVPE